MSDQHEINRAHEERIAQLEQELAALRPIAPVTRPRVSRRRAAVFGLILALLALPGVVLAGHGFSDVPNGHPFHDDIDWLADYGITQGFADGTYRPGEAVTRQAMAALMHRLSNEFEVVSSNVDPNPGHGWMYWAVCPDDKRPIAGGGFTGESNLFMMDSFPLNNLWYVRWETENDVTIDPSSLTVYALCAPRL